MSKEDNMGNSHHYLPRFYLKGFTGVNKKLFYCRKSFDSFNDVFPAGIYYEPGLNTIDLGEYGVIDLEKDFFFQKDDGYARAFHEFRNKYKYDLNSTPLQIKADIVEFVLGLYWRVPGRWQHVVDVIEEDGLLTGTLGLKNKETGKMYTDDEVPNIIQDIKDKVENQKALMTYYYEENVRKHNWDKLDAKFLIYETTEPMIIGDIPYVPLKTANRLGHILEEFIIPFDSNHILIYAQKHPPFLEANLLYLFYQCIIDGVSEKIASSDSDYLKKMVAQSKILHSRITDNGIGMSKEKALANLIEFESKFEDYNSFINYYSNLKWK